MATDLDVTVLMDLAQVPSVATQLAASFLVSRHAVEEAVQQAGTFRPVKFLHSERTFEIDVFVSDRSDYTSQLFARARMIPIGRDYEARIASPEDIVLAKLCQFKQGRCVKDRHWNDIVQVLEIQKGKLDEAYLDRWADHFGVRELLDEARSQTYD